MEKKSPLEVQLGELFDIKNAKARREKQINLESQEAHKEVKLLTLMFSDGIPSITIQLGDNERLEWDSQIKKLVYHSEERSIFMEGISKELLVKIRPHLNDLVKKAKEFYRD